MSRRDDVAAQGRQKRAPKLHHLLSKVGGVWWIAREQAEAELDSLLAERQQLIDGLRKIEFVAPHSSDAYRYAKEALRGVE